MTWQRGPRSFPDPYTAALGILRAAVTASSDPDIVGTSVVRTLPNPRPLRVVQVRRDGGSSAFGDLADAPLITYRVWHESDTQAQKLAQFIRAAFLNAPYVQGGTDVLRVEDVAGPLDVADPDDETVTTFFGRVQLWLRS